MTDLSTNTSDQPEPAASQAMIRPEERALGRFERSTTLVRSVFAVELQPLKKPMLATEFNRMGTIERILLAIEYQARVLEFRLGGNGWIRAWIVLSLRILIFAIVPMAAFLIALGFLVPAAAGVSTFFVHTEAAARSAFSTVIYGLLTALALAFGIAIFGVVFRLLRGR